MKIRRKKTAISLSTYDLYIVLIIFNYVQFETKVYGVPFESVIHILIIKKFCTNNESRENREQVYKTQWSGFFELSQ